jgi:hypothetical protein
MVEIVCHVKTCVAFGQNVNFVFPTGTISNANSFLKYGQQAQFFDF